MSLTREAELAALIAEQEADAAWGDRINYKRELSFEQPLGNDHDAGTLADVVGSQDDELQDLIENEAVGVRRITRRWNRRAIVSTIRQWEKEHGAPPTYNEWKRADGRGIPSAHTVQRYFGSWAKGIRAAGFDPLPVGGTKQPPGPMHSRFRRRIRKQRREAFLTQEQIASAYVLYDREGLSVPELSELLWRSYGFASRNVCCVVLQRAFHGEGFRMRSKSEALRIARSKGRYGKAAA